MFPEEELREKENLPFPNSKYRNYLYHYTDIDTVIKILKSENIRLTDYANLNDRSEGKLLFEKLKKKTNNKIVKEKIIKTHELLTKNSFVGSFSRYGNLLTLWRGYGNVAIGFDYEELHSEHTIRDVNGEDRTTSGLIITSCDYLNEHQIEKRANEIVSRYKSSIHETNSVENQYDLLTIGAEYFQLKHSGFLDERETRIICYLYNRSPFSNNGKKFIEYKFNKHSVKRIVFGPSITVENDLEKLNQLISTDKELQNIEIYESTIPFIQ